MHQKLVYVITGYKFYRPNLDKSKKTKDESIKNDSQLS